MQKERVTHNTKNVQSLKETFNVNLKLHTCTHTLNEVMPLGLTMVLTSARGHLTKP